MVAMMSIMLACVFSTFAMTGLIWFVQIVHYPLFAAVGRDQFVAYEGRHTVLTTWVVMPLMMVELGSSIWLAVHPLSGWNGLLIAAAILTVLIWLSTFFLQVPQHRILERGFDEAAWRFLVNSNWVRTVLWTARSAILCWMLGSMPLVV